MTPENILKKYWGYSSFRLSQKDVVMNILNGNDTLALLPTGGGKSVCYQVPGLLLPGLTVVISPLISLMKDQVDGLLKRNIGATYLATSLPKNELLQRLALLQQGKYKFLYLSPERLNNSSLQEALRTRGISLVVVDESHCISLWGSSFRPSYRNIPNFINTLPKRPIVAALTATATPTTIIEIIEGLELKQPKIFKSSFKRNISINLFHTTSHTEHELQLAAYLKNNKKSGIIYVTSRAESERLSNRLNSLRSLLMIDKIGCYHAGLSAKNRQDTQQKFINNQLQLLVCTTAFGMGIDKPNVDFVVHYHPPATLEGYYQEIGRGGRGGQQAEALFLFNPNHLRIHENILIKNKDPQHKSQQLFNDVLRFLKSRKCWTQTILRYFGEESENCGQCNVCQPKESPFQQLREASNDSLNLILQWRSICAKKYQIAPETILSPTQIAYVLALRPKTNEDLQLLPGFGHGWLKNWSSNFLSLQWYNTTESNSH